MRSAGCWSSIAWFIERASVFTCPRSFWSAAVSYVARWHSGTRWRKEEAGWFVTFAPAALQSAHSASAPDIYCPRSSHQSLTPWCWCGGDSQGLSRHSRQFLTEAVKVTLILCCAWCPPSLRCLCIVHGTAVLRRCGRPSRCSSTLSV